MVLFIKLYGRTKADISKFKTENLGSSGKMEPELASTTNDEL